MIFETILCHALFTYRSSKLQHEDAWRLDNLRSSGFRLPRDLFRRARASAIELEGIAAAGDVKRLAAHLTPNATLETWDSNPPPTGARKHPIDVKANKLGAPFYSTRTELRELRRFLKEIQPTHSAELAPLNGPRGCRIIGFIASNYCWAANLRFTRSGYRIASLILLEHGRAIRFAESSQLHPK